MSVTVIQQTRVLQGNVVINGEQAPIQVAAKVGKGETLTEALAHFDIQRRDPQTWEIIPDEEEPIDPEE